MFDIVNLLIFLPGILIALTIHEFSHALIAYKLGDPTAKFSGRLTLNPLSHIDPLGFIFLFLVHIGWAKPVPVDPYYFKNPEKDMAKVAIFGPFSNLILAFLISLILRIFFLFPFTEILFLFYLYKIFLSAYVINLILAFFNLLPIPPLDGSKILILFLPFEWKLRYKEIEPYGFFLLAGIIFISSFLRIPLFEILVFLPASLVSRLFLGMSPF
ncbi:MAG: site-2 protease family protein [candidate division WOR-3 bacterium]